MQIAIIGGGAAGFFSAIAAKENYPDSSVIIFEKSQKLLSKVKVSGGGRCNVTNGSTSIEDLSRAYPRGQKQMKNAFRHFSNIDTMKWFEERNVPLITQDDDCVFPVSQNSQSIIDCFLKEAKRLEIKILTGKGVTSIEQTNTKINLSFGEKYPSETFDKVIVTTGGSPKRTGLKWLEDLGHKVEEPVPSLFTFNMPKESITDLMGIVVEDAIVRIQGTKLKSEGPLLITHWGMSGPAILKASAFGARLLNDKGYNFKIQVNWVNEMNNELVYNELNNIIEEHKNKKLYNIRPFYIPERLWHFLLKKNEFSKESIWGQLGKKNLNKLTNILTNDEYVVKGKTTFKEEFVTCGGISLDCINMKTMQSKVIPNLYFAGELVDIDGITGGYNFQAAWTTAFIAAQLN